VPFASGTFFSDLDPPGLGTDKEVIHWALKTIVWLACILQSAHCRRQGQGKERPTELEQSDKEAWAEYEIVDKTTTYDVGERKRISRTAVRQAYIATVDISECAFAVS
jgi:hypothetical protein